MNFHSGNIASTFLTLSGFEALSGRMASTESFSRLQTVVALRFLISSLIGSSLSLPHRVPDVQPVEPEVVAEAEAVVATVAIVVAAEAVVTETVVVAVAVVVDTSPPYITLLRIQHLQ